MKKERFFPYWTDLRNVIAVAQSQTAADIEMTLVSAELYERSGFLLTFNVESASPAIKSETLRYGWFRPAIGDETGTQYAAMLANIAGVSYRHTFRGRTLVICRPFVQEAASRLSITIDTIEWEFVDDETHPPTQITAGPWRFSVSLQ